MKPILDGLKKRVVLGYTAGQGGGMVRNGPRDRTARSRSRGADRAFRAALVAALLSLLFLPGPIDAQQDAEEAAPADVAPPPPSPDEGGGDDAIVLNFEKARKG